MKLRPAATAAGSWVAERGRANWETKQRLVAVAWARFERARARVLTTELSEQACTFLSSFLNWFQTLSEKAVLHDKLQLNFFVFFFALKICENKTKQKKTRENTTQCFYLRWIHEVVTGWLMRPTIGPGLYQDLQDSNNAALHPFRFLLLVSLCQLLRRSSVLLSEGL